MSWKPDHGLWSVEEFSSLAGFNVTDLSKQTVTGGYAALVPQVERSVSYLHPWSAISGWDINNGLGTKSVLEADFHVTGGKVNAGDTQSGFQRSSLGGGMWEISTPHILGTGWTSYSGQTFEYFSLESGSPDTGYYYRLRASSDPFVVEFDVASTERVGSDVLKGIPSGQLTGLPALTGISNHGLYISNGPNWDYLEVRPDGIRSYNHPELAIPVNLTQPRRFRVGVRDTDIFILADDGRSLAGLGRFDAVSDSPTEPILAFGAPWTGNLFSFNTGSTVGFVGHSYWDNTKVLLGKLALDIPDGLENLYSTSTQSLYTPSFDAGVALKKWLSARVDYLHKEGGVTTITPEYLTATGSSDLTGYQAVDSAAVTLQAGSTVSRIDMSQVPASVPSQQSTISSQSRDLSTQLTTNKIRFRIDQHSSDGLGPAPLVDKISVQGAKDIPYLETVPDWKPVDRAADISLYIKTNKYSNTAPQPKANSTFFYSAPDTTGLSTGNFVELSNFGLTGSIVGTGQITSGPYNTSFQTYSFTTGSAVSGSDASKFFGTESINNFIPDPQFDKPFRNVSALSGYITGAVFGFVGEHVDLPEGYTGQARIEFSKHKVHRLGKSISDNFAQKVDITTIPPDNLCGMEVIMPSGISQSGTKGIFKFNLKVDFGPGVVVYATGSVQASGQTMPGEYYTGAYRPVSIPVDIISSGEGRFGVVGQTGGVGTYIVDDLFFAPIDTAYLKCTGVDTFKTPFGAIGTDFEFYTNWPPANPLRAATVSSCDLLLDIYPTGDNNVLIQKLGDTDGLGFTFYVNTGGFPVCDFDVCHNAFLTGGYTGTYESLTGVNNYGQPTGDYFLARRSITGELKVPLGRWTNVGFIHQSNAFRRFGGRTANGQSGLGSVASSNKAYITIDGLPVASQDTNPEWIELIFSGYTGTNSGDNLHHLTATPIPTFICDQTGSAIFASGLYCKVENIHINRPPSADAESELYMDSSRVGVPYFVPDVMLKPGGIDQDYGTTNAISDTTTGDLDSPGIYTASIYNLDNPGPITNWDHGANRNHLLFYGSVSKDTGNSPYGLDFGSTRFAAGGYGKAPYSSSLERFANNNITWNELAGISPTWPTDGQIIAGAWVYPRETGSFFQIAVDEASAETDSIEIVIVDATGARLRRKNTSGGLGWEMSGFLSEGSFLDSWHHLGFDYTWTGVPNRTAYTGISGSTVSFFVDGVVASTSEPTGLSASFLYAGNSLTGINSSMFLGKGPDCSMADVFINTAHVSSAKVDWAIAASSTGNKGGTYNQVFFDGARFTGTINYSGFSTAIVTLPKSTSPKETMLWAGVNEYANDEGENLDGIALYPSTSFTEAESYHFRYDDTLVNQVFGATDSPIRLGYILPSHAINLARVDSPSYSVPGAITTIDLSDSNPNNLSTFRGGQFSLSNANTIHRGRLVQKDKNGSFEIPAAGVTFTGLSVREIGSRNFTGTLYDSWFMAGGFADETKSEYAPYNVYDIIPGAGAGQAAGKGQLGNLAVTGGFHTSPYRGLHALGMYMASGHNNTGVTAVHTDITLKGSTDHYFTIYHKQPYYPNNSTATIAATIIGYTGNITTPIGTNVVAYYNPTTRVWISGAPNGFNGAVTFSPNVTPGDSWTGTSFDFNTSNFPWITPTSYGIWIDNTQGVLAVDDASLDFTVFDEVHVYEVVNTDASGSFKSINENLYSNQFDVVFKGQLDTEDIRVSSVSVADQELDSPAEAYYAYLLGRGNWGVSIPDAFPHPSGELSIDSRSGIVDPYLSNIEKIKKHISVRDFKGNDIDDFIWDIYTSPFSYTGLVSAVNKGINIAVDGIGSGQYTGYLDDGVFSVVMVSPHKPGDGNSIFVHFPAFGFESKVLETDHREIYNPIPIMRERLDNESPLAGQFSTALDKDNQKFYNLTVYGVSSGYSGNF